MSSRSQPIPWKREALLLMLVVAIALVGFGFLLEPGTMPYSKHSDLIAEHLPLKYAAWRSVEAGEGLPLWRRDMISGGPALTNPQAVYLHPLQWPYLVMHPTVASGFSLWLHFVCMGVSMLVLGAALGLGPLARVFMAVAGMFSFKGIAIAYAGWLPVLPGYMAAPLLIAGVLRAIDRPGKGAFFLLALAGSLLLLSGHLQIPYYLVLFLGVYLAAWAGRRLHDGEARSVTKAVGVVAPAACIALASAGYVLLPFFQELDLLARTTSGFDFLQSEGAFAAEKLATFLHPEILGTPLDDSYPDVSLWEDVAYFGAVPQILALFACFATWRRRHTPFLALAFAASIVLTFDSFLLRALHEWMPGFSLFRHPSRFLFLTSVFGIALSGVGVDALLARFSQSEGDGVKSWLPTVVAGVLFAVTLYDGATLAHRYLQTAPIARVVPERTGYGDFFAEDEGVYRVAPLQRAAINYGWAGFYDIELITGFEPHNYRHYQQYMNLLVSGRVVDPVPIVWTDLPGIHRWDLLETMGVKYVVSLEPLDPVPATLELRKTLPGEPVFAFYEGLGSATLFIYENLRARARGFWAEEIVSVRDAAAAMKALANRNLRRKTVVEVPDGDGLQVAARSPGDALRPVSRGASTLAFEAVSEAGGFAVVPEVWHPGWRATLDGAPVPILRTNGAFLGVDIPSGRHQLAMSFHPPGLETGSILTALAFLVLLIVGGLWVADLRGATAR